MSDTPLNTLPLLLLLAVLALGTLRAGVVLAVLRAGIGRDIPPAPIVAVLALLLSILSTAPLATRCHAAMSATNTTDTARLEAGLAPVRDYLGRHTPPRERAAVLDLARRARPPAERDAVHEGDLQVLAPAFALAELRLAFQMGFLLLLPFLILDLLISSLLSGLILPGLSARAVALPFKLLLFVLADGWQLLARGLVPGDG